MNEQKEYNMYCDESCHLQYDKSEIMCVGGLVISKTQVPEYKAALKEIKGKHGIFHEVKWNTMSATHLEMYKELISFFFTSQMSFRSILIKNKSNISAHTIDRGKYNSFYFSVIEKLIRFSIQHNGSENNNFRVYLDLKDAHSSKKLQAVDVALNLSLSRNNTVSLLQNIRSHESVFIQLADILLGAISYRARGLHGSKAKSEIVHFIEEMSGYKLDEGTEPGDVKFSIYDFQPKKRNG